MKIYAFAFSLHNISTRTLYSLENIDHRYLIFRNNINRYLEILKENNPDHIIGLGVYGKRTDNLVIEQKCFNNFRGREITIGGKDMYELNPFVKQNSHMKYAETIGNYMCNLISYKIMELIDTRQLSSSFTFVHLPKILKFDHIAILNEETYKIKT